MFESKFHKFMRSVFTFIGNVLLGALGSAIFALIWTIILTGAYWLFTGVEDIHETAQGIFVVAFFVGVLIHGIKLMHRL